jgi:hypothetical protein
LLDWLSCVISGWEELVNRISIRTTAQQRRISFLALAAAVLATQTTASAQIIGKNFAGVDENFSGFVPPDAGGVGQKHFVQLLNGAFAIYTKQGTLAAPMIPDNDFWVTAFNNSGTPYNPGEVNISDPRIIFDQLSGRWFASETNFDNSTSDYQVMIARSNTSDPTQGFKAIRFNASSAAGTGGQAPDFQMLGLDNNGVYIGANDFPNSGGSFVSMYSLPKSDVLAATPTAANVSRSVTQAVSTHGWSPQPVVDFTLGKSAATPEIVLATSSDTPINSTVLRRSTVTGASAPGATWSTATNITVPTYNIPPDGQQPTVTATIGTIDGRFQATVFQVGGALWAVHDVAVSGRAAIRWYKIDASTFNVLLSGTLSDPNFDFESPSIAANAAGYVVIGASRSGTASPAGLPGAYAWVGTPGSGTVNFTAGTAPIMLKAGEDSYGASGAQRWGDYSATNVDPADPQIFWTSQEYAKTSNPTWGTQISEILVPLAGEVRWANAASGSFSTGTNYFSGSAPVAASHTIFSREGDPYTVTMPTGTTTNDRASFRQGSVTMNLSGGTYTLANSSAATPSVAIAEFNGIANATFTNGTLKSVNALIAAGNVAVASVSLGSATWNNSASMSIGGSATTAGGAATLSIGSSTLNVTGRLKVWNTATVSYNSGTLNAGTVDITGGQVLFTTGKNKVIVTSGVSIAGGGKIDLADNFIIVNYSGASPGPQSALAALIKNGYNSGNWAGTNSISSSSAAAAVGSLHKTAIGYADSVALGTTSFAGRTLTSSAVLIRYTLFGDADLNGTVDLSDFTRLAASFNTVGTSTWLKGDFNYDGNTDLTDFSFLASNFNTTLPAGEIGAVVPEPATLALAAAGLLSLYRRRL